MYLVISNSDGDVSCKIWDEFPDMSYYGEGEYAPCVHGSELLKREPDSNYWDENAIVVLKVEDV